LAWPPNAYPHAAQLVVPCGVCLNSLFDFEISPVHLLDDSVIARMIVRRRGRMNRVTFPTRRAALPMAKPMMSSRWLRAIDLAVKHCRTRRTALAALAVILARPAAVGTSPFWPALVVVIPLGVAHSVPFTMSVPCSALWVNTGVSLNVDSVTISASGAI